MLIDTHAHLTDDRLDYRQIISAMQSDGLKKIITVGYDVKTSIGGADISEEFDDVYFAAGIHPNDCGNMTDGDLSLILDLAQRKKAVAIGEIGLDYHHDDVPHDMQKKQLERLLAVVKESKLPAMFHLRDAYGDMRKIITAQKSNLLNGAVMHCFSGDLSEAKFYLDLGFYLSFTGVITFDERLTDVIKYTPTDRILVETDCPYLAPKPFRGKTNSPKYVKYVAEKIALIKEKPFEEIANITTKNAYDLFKKLN